MPKPTCKKHIYHEQILLSFVGDVYCDSTDGGATTRAMLQLLNTYNAPVAVLCEVCGGLVFMDDYGNGDKCPNCGWIQSSHNELMEKWHGISYPVLVPLSRAREQYKKGQKFKATFEDFINGLNWYKEMLFWHNDKYYAAYYRDSGISLENREILQTYKDVDDFVTHANIDGRLLKDIWDEVVHPCFMYCGEEHDYDYPPED